MTRILVVEDSEDLCFIMKAELEWRGFAVDIARDAPTALEIARLARPDVIVSDLGMPEMDGLELIKRVRQIPELKAVPAIALTGSTMDLEVQQALAAGFTLHVAKPVEIRDLISIIGKLTEKRLRRKAG